MVLAFCMILVQEKFFVFAAILQSFSTLHSFNSSAPISRFSIPLVAYTSILLPTTNPLLVTQNSKTA